MSVHPQPLYFGKLPSRGDFVRSPHSPAVIHTLDQWLTGGLESMLADPRWKEVYDGAPAAHFAVLGPRNPVGLAGHLVPSRDQSGRRFPFIVASRVDAAPPLRFLARSPLALGRAWMRCAQVATAAVDAQDGPAVLAAVSGQGFDIDASAEGYEAAWRDFTEMQTLASLARLLQSAGHSVDVRTLLLGLGLLLQPVPASGTHALDKGLLLPLPADPLYGSLVAALWMELIAGFVARAEFELVLFVPVAAAHQPPVALLGFDGASARVLRAVLDAAAGRDLFIDTRDAAWVDGQLDATYPLHKLSSYLVNEGLSLRQAVESFKETFLGS